MLPSLWSHFHARSSSFEVIFLWRYLSFSLSFYEVVFLWYRLTVSLSNLRVGGVDNSKTMVNWATLSLGRGLAELGSTQIYQVWLRPFIGLLFNRSQFQSQPGILLSIIRYKSHLYYLAITQCHLGHQLILLRCLETLRKLWRLATVVLGIRMEKGKFIFCLFPLFTQMNL